MGLRYLLWGLALVVVVFAGLATFFLITFEEPAVDPAWAIYADAEIPDDAVTVRYSGTSTLLFSNGETDWMVDGWFSRFGPLQVALGQIAPDQEAITRGLERNQVDSLAVVIPIHSHFDHAMDSPEVAPSCSFRRYRASMRSYCSRPPIRSRIRPTGPIHEATRRSPWMDLGSGS